MEIRRNNNLRTLQSSGQNSKGGRERSFLSAVYEKVFCIRYKKNTA